MTEKQRLYIENLIKKVFKNEPSQGKILSMFRKSNVTSAQASKMIHALRLEINISRGVPSYMFLAGNLNPRMEDFYKIIGFND